MISRRASELTNFANTTPAPSAVFIAMPSTEGISMNASAVARRRANQLLTMTVMGNSAAIL